VITLEPLSNTEDGVRGWTLSELPVRWPLHTDVMEQRDWMNVHSRMDAHWEWVTEVYLGECIIRSVSRMR
jgi:hypothetical protein